MEYNMAKKPTEFDLVRYSTLAQKSKLYWELSLARRHMGPLKGINTERALVLLTGIEAGLDDSLPLRWHVGDLINQIVGIQKEQAKMQLEEGLSKTRLRGYTPTQATRIASYKAAFGSDPDDDGPRAA